MIEKNEKKFGLVYSTGYGRMCPSCEKPIAQCTCRQKKTVLHGDGFVRITRETKGRKGKCVIVIRGVPLSDEELEQLTKKLKQKCGTGGTLKDGVIEIQGDHRELLVKELSQLGYKVKIAGG